MYRLRLDEQSLGRCSQASSANEQLMGAAFGQGSLALERKGRVTYVRRSREQSLTRACLSTSKVSTNLRSCARTSARSPRLESMSEIYVTQVRDPCAMIGAQIPTR